MLDHTGIVVSDLPKARKFYDAVAKALGLGIVVPHKDFLCQAAALARFPICGSATLRPSYWVEGSRAGINQMHVAFAAKDNAMVEESTAPHSRPAAATMASLALAKRATTARSCWTGRDNIEAVSRSWVFRSRLIQSTTVANVRIDVSRPSPRTARSRRHVRWA